jgi:hypothetical protein
LIRALASLALLAAACSGPTTPVPTGFGGGSCAGTRISGESEMGVGKTRPGEGTSLITDVDARIVMSGRVGGSCFGAAVDADDRVTR